MPKFIYKIVDGIVLTDSATKNVMAKQFLDYGIEAKKIILWNENLNPELLNFETSEGLKIVCVDGMEFHIRTQEDVKFVNELLIQIQRQNFFYSANYEMRIKALENFFASMTGRGLDWNNLKTWAEKIQWLKIHYFGKLQTRLADKFLVRFWVEEKIGSEYLIPLLGVWDKFDDIDFDLLPDQFVLQCNHGCNMNVICRDKKTFDFENAREKFDACMEIDYGTFAFEPHYNDISKKIIAEKFLSDGENFDLVDYKFWCFDGRPFMIQCETDRSNELKFDYFDSEWKCLHVERRDHPNSDHPEKISKPKNFELMKELAKKLSEGIKFVRVDFYEVHGKIYFGEMTFTPGGGYVSFKTEGFDEKLGSLIKIET